MADDSGGRGPAPWSRFEEVFRATYAELCTYARRYVDDDATAEDVVQEVFAAVWENRADRPVSDLGPAYLYRAVRNRALNRVRDGERTESLDAPEAPDAETSLGARDVRRRREVASAVDEAVDDLPPRCRQVFLLVRERGLSYREAAERLDLSPSTVETQMGRALRRLRESLAPLLGDD